MTNSIIAGNTAASAPDLQGCASGGHNLIGGTPLLGTLGNNGGLTQTVPLLAGSPAIGTGDPAVCAAAPVGGKDQREKLAASGSVQHRGVRGRTRHPEPAADTGTARCAAGITEPAAGGTPARASERTDAEPAANSPPLSGKVEEAHASPGVCLRREGEVRRTRRNYRTSWTQPSAITAVCGGNVGINIFDEVEANTVNRHKRLVCFNPRINLRTVIVVVRHTCIDCGERQMKRAGDLSEWLPEFQILDGEISDGDRVPAMHGLPLRTSGVISMYWVQ